MNLFDCMSGNNLRTHKKLNMLVQNRRKFDEFFQKSCSSTNSFVFAKKENKTIFFSLLSFFLTCDKMI